MNKQEFLSRLGERLAGLPQNEAAERLAFYSEMIDDRMEDGLSEEEAVAGIGSVERVAEQIIAETPLPVLVREKMRPGRRLRAWEIVLLALGAPIWLSLLIAAFAVLFSLYVVIWALLISLWAVELSLIVAALGTVAAGILFLCQGDRIQGVLLICAGAVLAGLSIFLFYGCLAATKGAARLTGRITLWVKSKLLRKDDAK